MKLSIAVWLCASALACSHEARPPIAPTPAPPATSISRLEEAPVQESAPTTSGIPAAPAVAPPKAPPAPPETALSLKPAAGLGPARNSTAALVPGAPAPDDRAQNTQDEESIREIRALLASDPALAPMAAKMVIVARKGQVWLRGQVNTAEQRATVEKAARQAAGVINVKNELITLE